MACLVARHVRLCLEGVMSDYVYQPYPAWRYHPVHGMSLVNSKEEDEALLAQEGWVDSHLKLPSATAEAAPAPAPESQPEQESDADTDTEPKSRRTKRK